MQAAQIAILATLLVVSIFILIGGYLYVRTQNIKERIQYSIHELEELNIDVFEAKIHELENIKNYQDEDRIEKLVDDFNDLKVQQINVHIKDLYKANKSMSWFWINPFRDAKKLLYKEQDKFTDYKYKKWYQITRPFKYMTNHVIFLGRASSLAKIQFMKLQTDYSRIALEKEMNDKYLDIIKHEYNHYREIATTSTIPQFKDSPIIRNSIISIDDNLNKFDKIIHNITKLELSEMFNSIKGEVIEFAERVTIMESAYRLLFVEREKRLNQAVGLYKENSKLLGAIKIEAQGLLDRGRRAAEALNNALLKHSIKNISVKSKDLDLILTAFEKLISRQVMAGHLVEKSHTKLLDIVMKIDDQDRAIAAELTKYTEGSFDQHYMPLNADSNVIRSAEHAYRTARRETYSGIKPWDLLTKQADIKETYKKHIAEVSKKLYQIKDLLEDIELIRDDVLAFSNTVLNIESLVNKLPETLVIKHNNALVQGKKISNKLVNLARNGGEIEENIAKQAKKLVADAEQIFRDVYTDGFLNVYVKKAILLLQIMDSNGKYADKIERFKMMYNDGNFNAEILKEIEPILRKVKN